MGPPRALWVPFILGRPFGVPGDGQFQQRVLRAALRLLEARPVRCSRITRKKRRRRPQQKPKASACPVSFDRKIDADDLGAALAREIEELAPWHDLAAKRRERTTTGLKRNGDG